jgi:putative spermidine/putrescine transport system substrate-binding protein
MILRSVFAIGLVVAGLHATTPRAQASELTVAMPGGKLARVLTETIITPFTQATGTSVDVATTDGSIAAARAAHADVLLANPSVLQESCKGGALAKLDWGALGGRERTLPGTSSDCGEGAVLRSTVLAWNRDKFPGQPNWAEFWDVAKVPGKRGLRHGARGNLEIALLADGVPPGDVYSTLRTDGGIDRAFRKLDQLKPYVVWWDNADQPPKLLESGEALMTSAPAESIVGAERGEEGIPHPDFAVQWAGSLLMVENWALLAGSLSTTAAMKFLAFAADPKNQRRLAAFGGYGATSSGATEGLKPDQLAASPSAPANFSAGLMVDEAFWHDNGAKLDKQFDAWLAK